MHSQSKYQSTPSKQNKSVHRSQLNRSSAARANSKPPAAYRQRVPPATSARNGFNAPEVWHEPLNGGAAEFRDLRMIVQPAGAGYIHPVTVDEVRARLAQLPAAFTRQLEVVQFSRMTRKRRNFPCYGMQWGQTVYLYPIEASLVESYIRPPKPAQQIEARMFGGVWKKEGPIWTLSWTTESIKDFYLNNVLIHEVGHINDQRNTRYREREHYANWFAVEYGYRASRQRR